MSESTTCLYCAGIGELEATDIFCGAGGSSLGLEFVCCPYCARQLIRVTQALNHWDLAVQSHNANFPDADHDVHDVEVIPARRFRRTPLLWASPECTHHAYCRGPQDGTPEASRSRATFADIARFTAHHRYDAVIVENVVEARLWCEHKRCSCGESFDAWLKAMCDLGYDAQIVYFNSQFTLTPQSRDRMYVVFWRQGVRRPNLDFRPPSWCSSCATVVRGRQHWKRASKGSLRTQPGKFEWGRYGQQYLYTCPNEGCGQPVAPAVQGSKTIIDWSLEAVRIGDRPKPLAPKTRTRIKNGLERLSTTKPVTVQVGGHLYERQGYSRVWSVDDPLRAVTGTQYMGLAVPAGGQEANARSLEEPSHTILGNDRLALTVPGKSDTVPAEVEEPMGTVTGRPHAGLVVRVGGQQGHGRGPGEPMQTVIGSDRQVALVVQNMEHNSGRDVEEPGPPVTTGGNHMLVQVNRGGGKGGRRALGTDEPTPTIAGHGELGLVEFRGAHGTVRSGDLPAHTVTAKGTHHGVLVYNGNPGFVRDLADAAGTVTGRDKQALLVPYNRTGVARPTDVPAGTVTTRDREALVISEADIDDCLFRMLQWPELLKAQQMHAHPDGAPYQLTARMKDKRGKTRELSNEKRVKMIGNAVSSPVATMLGYALVEALR